MPVLKLTEEGQNIEIIRPYGSTVGGDMPINVFYCKDDECNEDNESVKGTKLTTNDYLVSRYVDDDATTWNYTYYKITEVKGTKITYYDHDANETVILKRQGIAFLKNRYYLKDSDTTKLKSKIKYWASENEVMNMLVQWYEDIDGITKESELLLDNIKVDIYVKDNQNDKGFYDLQLHVSSKAISTPPVLFTKWTDYDNIGKFNTNNRCYNYIVDTNKNATGDFNTIDIYITHNIKTNKINVLTTITYVRNNNSLMYVRDLSSSLHNINYTIIIRHCMLPTFGDCCDPSECSLYVI
jgi:hypothetical protein